MKFLLSFLLLSFACINCDYEWMYLVKYGNDVTMAPLAPPDSPADFVFGYIESCTWISNDFKTEIKSDTEKYSIDQNTCKLTIKNVQKSDNGIYHAKLNDTHISKAMLNYHGPPYDSLSEEYKYNLIAGFSTAGGKFLLYEARFIYNFIIITFSKAFW